MVVFHSDLDNTLIYSYKHDIGSDKKCVEVYQNREVSFMTKKSFDLLKAVKEKVVFVPTTTRTQEQYERIDLGIGIPRLALVCNGGVLLADGREDTKWYEESLNLIMDCGSELEKSELYLETDKYRSFEVRNIRGLFVFTKSDEPERTMAGLKDILNLSLVDVFRNGAKVYVVPKKMSKGMAVQRLRKRLEAELVIAAGDSEFDISMLHMADIGSVPPKLKISSGKGKKIVRADEKGLYSDWVLEYVLRDMDKKRRSLVRGDSVFAAVYFVFPVCIE